MSGTENAILVRQFADAHERLENAKTELRNAEIGFGQAQTRVTGRQVIPQGEARTLRMEGGRLLTIKRGNGGSYTFTYSDLVSE